MRRETRAVRVKDVQIGGGAPIAVQSMTKTETTDVEGTVRQIEEIARTSDVSAPAKAEAEKKRRYPDLEESLADHLGTDQPQVSG